MYTHAKQTNRLGQTEALVFRGKVLPRPKTGVGGFFRQNKTRESAKDAGVAALQSSVGT